MWQVSLVTKLPGPGYTFILAGFLKIVTVGWVSTTAPTGAARTVLGQYSQYLLVPVSLLMCWVAKKVADAGLHENKRFMAGLVAGLVLLYFGLVRVLFR